MFQRAENGLKRDEPMCSRQGSLWRQAAGGVPWGAFFIFAPVDVLIMGALVWIPLLIWSERVRELRCGFWPGAVARLTVVAVIVTTAALLPVKYEDGRVGPLPRVDMSFKELADGGVIYPISDDEQLPVRVVLPSLEPTRREVMQAIIQQTGLNASIFHCGNGATVLFGGGGGRIRVSGKRS